MLSESESHTLLHKLTHKLFKDIPNASNFIQVKRLRNFADITKKMLNLLIHNFK